MFKRDQKGFTLIELLVVVAIIGMLLSIIVISFGNARIKSRDAKRLSDIKQVKTGLDLFYSSGAGYPDSSMWSAGSISCSTEFIMNVPNDPLSGIPYDYQTQTATTGCGGSTWKEYKIEFTTEGQTDLGPAGIYYLGISGVTTTPPF